MSNLLWNLTWFVDLTGFNLTLSSTKFLQSLENTAMQEPSRLILDMLKKRNR